MFELMWYVQCAVCILERNTSFAEYIRYVLRAHEMISIEHREYSWWNCCSKNTHHTFYTSHSAHEKRIITLVYKYICICNCRVQHSKHQIFYMCPYQINVLECIYCLMMPYVCEPTTPAHRKEISVILWTLELKNYKPKFHFNNFSCKNHFFVA